MNTKPQFIIDQKVRIRDEDTGRWVTGHVTAITATSIFVKWFDMPEPIEHFEPEFNDIKPLHKPIQP